MGRHEISWLLLLVAVGVAVGTTTEMVEDTTTTTEASTTTTDEATTTTTEDADQCNLLDFSPCDQPCGGGVAMAVSEWCTDDETGVDWVCGITSADCNMASCEADFSGWSNCSASCGYGEQTRFNGTGHVQTRPCNLKACDAVECTDSTVTDIVFMLSNTDNMMEYGFEVMKQLAADVVAMISTGGEVRVAMVSFAVHPEVVFSFTNAPEVDYILEHRFNGGAGVPANGLLKVQEMFRASNATNKILITLSDAKQHIGPLCVLDESEELQADGVEMFALTLRIGYMEMLNPLSSQPFAEHQFQAGCNTTSMRLANAILSITCGKSDLISVPEDQGSCNSTNPDMAGQQNGGVLPVGCHYEGPTPCTVTCGRGTQSRFTVCPSEGVRDEEIRKCHMPNCHLDPDCSRCNYTMGQIWLPDSSNCHEYFICEKVGASSWTHHHGNCGNLYWDQARLTCVREKQEGCTDQTAVTIDHPSTTEGICTYTAVEGDESKFRSLYGGAVQDCGNGRKFALSICGCVRMSGIETSSCSDDLLLHFPYNDDIHDVTCHHALGYVYGEGDVEIVHDADRGYVVQFDGNARIEVPFMRNWFENQAQIEFTVSVWVKRSAGNDGTVGIVHNGDCMADPTFLIYGDEDAMNKEVLGGFDTIDSDLTYTDTLVASAETWHHVVLVKDESNMTLYVDCVKTETTAITGSIDSVQNSMMIGAKGCTEDNMGFFEGRIDDLRVYTRAWSPAEVCDFYGP